jgi:hypothetical protein
MKAFRQPGYRASIKNYVKLLVDVFLCNRLQVHFFYVCINDDVNDPSVFLPS